MGISISQWVFLCCGLCKINVTFISAGNIMQKYFHVRSNLCLIHFEHFQEKTLHAEGNNIPEANLKCTCRFTRLPHLDTVRIMSKTNIEGVTPLSCKQNNALLCLS